MSALAPWRPLFGLVILALAWAGAAAGEESLERHYRLGAGDRIAIQVFGEDDLSVEPRLGESGTINFPLLGELKVSGLTTGELEQLIARRLRGPFLVDPVVSVNISEYRPFFVNGEVNQPGAIPFQPGITMRKAVAMSGGFTERAKRSEVQVISGGDGIGQPRSAGLDEQVRPGDIITVRQSFF